jgi:hypothetical protein
VPDIAHLESVGITGVTDGTEGLAPSVSEGEDLGGEGAPSTDGLGGGPVGPDLGGSWGGAGGGTHGVSILVPSYNFLLGGSGVTGVACW